MDRTARNCDYKSGSLPGACAPLASAYVPMQDLGCEVYPTGKALLRGTLFPGLDLPFKNYVNNGSAADTPAAELMALSFAALDLGLYLDTHPDDCEAFELYTRYVRLYNESAARYVRLYGPLVKTDTATQDSFTWHLDPWPWDVEGGASNVCV